MSFGPSEISYRNVNVRSIRVVSPDCPEKLGAIGRLTTILFAPQALKFVIRSVIAVIARVGSSNVVVVFTLSFVFVQILDPAECP